MKKNTYFLCLVSRFSCLVSCLLFLASCDEWSMKQIENQLQTTDLSIQDARSFVYDMAASDYAIVADNKANIALALSLDEDSTAYKALQQIKTDKCFSDEASADMYVPAFIKNLYPQLSVGAQAVVNYTQMSGKSTYQKPFATASAYTLSDDDYKAIWGGRGAAYIAPTTEAQLPDFLASKFPSAVENKIFVLTYQYSEQEPDTIYPPLNYICTVKELLEAQETVEHQLTGYIGAVTSKISGRFYLKDTPDGADSILVYGITDEDGNKVFSKLGMAIGDQVTLKGRYASTETEPQIKEAVLVNHSPANAPRRAAKSETTVTKTAIYQLINGVWTAYTNDQVKGVVILPQEVYDALGATSVKDPQATIDIFLRNRYPYANVDDDYFVVYVNASGATTGDDFIYDGTHFVLKSGLTAETMNFLLKQDKGWVADISTFLNEPFIGHGQGDFVLQNVLLTGGLNYVWKYDASYGMKASAYYQSTNNPSEAWLVSPSIRLKKAKNPALIFDMTQKYAGNFAEECKVFVSTDYEGDVTTCTWTQLPYLTNEDGTLNVPDGSSWTFQSSGEMPLTDYIEKTIWIGFRYTSNESHSATWEIKNLLVHELETEE
ncbi:MAG: choice-of-anchor J domain-containing protein [Paludibacteraceae bacterium]|nr:choice-of-anchor J domain-containing protein [Paludibacteraceae bacterium]